MSTKDKPQPAFEPEPSGEQKPKENWFTPKDWATLTLATLALIVSVLSLSVSGTTAFLTFIRQTEELSAVFVDYPSPITRSEGVELNSDRVAAVLMNSGNQTVTVYSARLYVDQSYIFPSDTVCNNGVELSMAMEPLVLRGKDTGAVSARIAQPLPQNATLKGGEKFHVQLSRENRSRDEFWVQVCFLVRFVTPSHSGIGTKVSLGTFLVKRTSTGMLNYYDDRDGREKPKLLWSKEYRVWDWLPL